MFSKKVLLLVYLNPFASQSFLWCWYYWASLQTYLLPSELRIINCEMHLLWKKGFTVSVDDIFDEWYNEWILLWQQLQGENWFSIMMKYAGPSTCKYTRLLRTQYMCTYNTIIICILPKQFFSNDLFYWLCVYWHAVDMTSLKLV